MADQLGELEAVLEAELRRAELIASALERIDDSTEDSQLPATA
ncbi:MAG TPA: hypothetical protein VFZ70_02690 [Euzebyales bacterium]